MFKWCDNMFKTYKKYFYVDESMYKAHVNMSELCGNMLRCNEYKSWMYEYTLLRSVK